MSLAQQQSLHTLGFTPRSWESRTEAHARGRSWAELSEKQQRAARNLGWDEEAWTLRWGVPETANGIVWKPEQQPRTPRVSKLEAIKVPTALATHGLFQEMEYVTIADPYRARDERVERRAAFAESGVCHEALMSRARGKGFTMQSPRHGRMKDAYFKSDPFKSDSGQHLQRELTTHQMAACTDRSHGTFGMTRGQHGSQMMHNTGSTALPLFAYGHANRSTRSYYSNRV
jgi:hypothetical protein